MRILSLAAVLLFAGTTLFAQTQTATSTTGTTATTDTTVTATDTTRTATTAKAEKNPRQHDDNRSRRYYRYGRGHRHDDDYVSDRDCRRYRGDCDDFNGRARHVDCAAGQRNRDDDSGGAGATRIQLGTSRPARPPRSIRTDRSWPIGCRDDAFDNYDARVITVRICGVP